MSTVEVIPGLVLDEAMYEAAAAGIAAYAPKLAPLTFERFTEPGGWSMIPDNGCNGYKAEMILSESREATRKLNVWFAADRRGGAKPMPHSHPWAFRSRILLGGYTEDRYLIDGDRLTTEFNVAHALGTANDVPEDLYHEVTEIHGEPGRTLTLMVCERGTRGNWGYLDVSTGKHVQVQPDPRYAARFNALNPHHR